MAATIDDLLASSQRVAIAVERLLNKQAQRNRQYAQRRSNWWGMSPRRHIHRGMSHLLGGRWGAAKKEFGKGWTSFKKTRGFSGTGIVGKASAVVTVLDMFRKAVIKATEAAVAMNRHYAEMSASMAAVMAQRDVKELMRDMRKGEKIAPSARMMTEAEQSRKDAHEQIDVLGARLENMAMAGLNKLAEAILTPFNEVAGAINRIMDKLPKWLGGGADDPKADAAEYLEDVERRNVNRIRERQQSFRDIAKAAEEARRVRGW